MRCNAAATLAAAPADGPRDPAAPGRAIRVRGGWPRRDRDSRARGPGHEKLGA